jgi:uncharacterized protein (DUF2384 family)
MLPMMEPEEEREAETIDEQIIEDLYKATESGGVVEPVDAVVMEYAEVLAHAVDTFGSRTNANAWLNRPNRVFNQRSPLQILTQDPGAVEEELVRIDHGIFL